MNKSSVGWAPNTLNVVHGCSRPAAVVPAVFDLPPELLANLYPSGIAEKWKQPNSSPECVRCYAENISHRFKLTQKPCLECYAAENVQLHPERFREIGKLKVKPLHLPPSQRERIFICSMGDIFHELVPDDFLHELFDWMARYPHIFMLLTKRPERAAGCPGPWPENIWLGTTCGHPITKWRLEYLRLSRALTRFVSAEPLLQSILPLNLEGIHQVILGDESGSGFRPMDMAWAREVRDECANQRVAFFFKQDAAKRPESRPYLVEEDGRCFQYQPYPGELTPPVLIDPANLSHHAGQFRILT